METSGSYFCDACSLCISHYISVPKMDGKDGLNPLKPFQDSEMVFVRRERVKGFFGFPVVPKKMQVCNPPRKICMY